jgi:hypothetical protein
MSWSVIAAGPVEAVTAQLKTDFAKVNSSANLAQHEEHVKDAAAKLVFEVLKLQPKGSAVKVKASGSVSDPGSSQQYDLEILVEGTADADAPPVPLGTEPQPRDEFGNAIGPPWAPAALQAHAGKPPTDSKGVAISKYDHRPRNAQGDLIAAGG